VAELASGQQYLLVPCQLLLGKLVGLGMVEESFFQLGIDSFKLLEGSLLSHGDGVN